MAEQGRSTFASGEEGWILDRLAALAKIISPELVRRVLTTTGKVNGRACMMTYEVTLWLVLAMGLLTHLPIRQVFRWSRRLRLGEKCPQRSTLCVARRRLGVEPVKKLFEELVRPLATRDTPGAYFRQWKLMALDGTVLDVPDSGANAVFGRSSGGRGAAPFPQIRKVSLVELGTHIECAIAIGGWNEDERTLARTLWDKIPADALLIMDRGYYSFEDWKVLETKVKLLCRVQKHMVLKPIKRLPDGSYLAKVYRHNSNRISDRDGIVVRVIEYTLNEPLRNGHGEPHRLITNILDPNEATAEELVVLYHERWEHELVFDEGKTHHDPRRAEKPAQLRSESPEGVRQEVHAVAIAHFVIRALMYEAAKPVKMDTDRLSFVGCFRILQCRLPECCSLDAVSLNEWFAAILNEMRSERIEPRRNRVNPRVIKRKMSKWPKKRPEHRRPKQPTKTFRESIVMLN